MSNSNQATLPDPQAAYQHVFDNVHSRVFFGRLGQVYGIQPQNAKEAQDLLILAGKLRQVETEKVANDNRFGGALQSLNAVLGEVTPTAQEQELSYKQAADFFAADPLTYNSILALKAVEAAQLAGANQQS